MRLSRFLFVFLVISGCFASTRIEAVDFRLGLLHGNAEIFDFELGIFRQALEHASGDHRLIIVPMKGTVQNRVFAELKKGNIDLFFSGYSKQREDEFLQIDFPLTRGLLGHRVFMIQKGRQHRFDAIQHFSDLQEQISIGSGIGWPESVIFPKAGLKVETAIYEDLWRMLERGRFDAFHRGIHEVQVEMKQRQDMYVELEKSLMLLLKYDYFPYVRKDDQLRHDILKEGFYRLIRSGTYEKYFYSHAMIRDIQKNIRPQDRKTFRIPNPDMEDVLKRIPDYYWVDLGRPETSLKRR